MSRSPAKNRPSGGSRRTTAKNRNRRPRLLRLVDDAKSNGDLRRTRCAPTRPKRSGHVTALRSPDPPAPARKKTTGSRRFAADAGLATEAGRHSGNLPNSRAATHRRSAPLRSETAAVSNGAPRLPQRLGATASRDQRGGAMFGLTEHRGVEVVSDPATGWTAISSAIWTVTGQSPQTDAPARLRAPSRGVSSTRACGCRRDKSTARCNATIVLPVAGTALPGRVRC